MRRLAWIMLTVLLVLVVWLWWPRQGPPEAARAGDVSGGNPVGAVTAHWLGVSALLLRSDTSAILIDPFFTRAPGKFGLLVNRRVRPDEAVIEDWLERLGVRRLDAVAVSHTHYDHALDAGVVARRTGAVLLGSESTAQVGRGAGMDEDAIRVVAPGEWVAAGDFRIRFHPSRHAGATGGFPRGTVDAPLVPPAGPLAYREGGTFSIEMAHETATVLHHGSAGFEPGALDGVCADTVFLGIALVDDMARYLDAVVGTTGAGQVYAVHWDDFTRPLREPLRRLPFGVDFASFLEGGPHRFPDVAFATLDLAAPVQLPHGRCGHDGSP